MIFRVGGKWKMDRDPAAAAAAYECNHIAA